jgi:HAD superfamily hydrolase (TIGR01484 family)
VQVAHQLDVHVQAFTADNRLIYERVREESILYEQRTNLKGEIQNLLDFFSENHPASVIKVMFIAEPERLSEIETELDRAYGTTFYRTRTQTTYLEVLAPGVSKGAGLKLALQFRGISPASTIAFGDADNDVSLADVAAYFIAPANAIPAVQQRAQLIVPSNEEEGPAHFIAEHVLCDAEHVLHK